MAILRMREVIEMTGLSRTTIWRRIKNGQFPKPIRLGGEGTRCVGFLDEEIYFWIDTRQRADDDGDSTESQAA